ncbi:MAG: hypothetical protein KGZ94_12945 [Clostridia bacterium]|nr:hypothetical protein [Clostridia bacterium]MBS3971007.1 hypothetical protein [Clostridia bacterium]
MGDNIMEVIALVGPSGSGKSHRALLVAHEYNIDIIIDDGLAIKGSQILAGISAKKQPTKVGAIKTALFSSQEHADDVKSIICKEKAKKILILGTSNEMVYRIAIRLNLPAPETIVYIRDIATEKEIEQAYNRRKKHGTHVVPAPTLAVKPRFSGLMIQPFKVLFSNSLKDNVLSKPIHLEQTVVRPTFNYLGKFYIKDPALKDIIKYSVKKSGFYVRLTKIDIETRAEGIIIGIELLVKYGVYSIPMAIKKIQGIISADVEYMTAINVLSINVLVKSVYIE